MSYSLYLIYTLAYAVLLLYGTRILRRQFHISTVLLLIVTFGVFYDNLILAVGNRLGAGDLLWALSLPRFVLHQLALPWIIYAGYDQARQAGQGWAQPRAARWGAMALSVLVMLAGIVTRLLGLHLEPEVMDGVLRYVAVGVVGPPIVSIVSIGLVGIAGLVFWRQNRWPWIFLAAVAVFVGESLPDESLRRAVGSALEVVFLAVLFITQQRLDSAVLGSSATPWAL